MKTVLQVVLLVAALGLTYLIYNSIKRPIDFEKESFPLQRHDRKTQGHSQGSIGF